jgi:hypothetical protein
MNISEILKYKKFVLSGKNEDVMLSSLSDRYSEQYNESISHFDILIGSDRADTINKDGTSYKCIVDYGKLPKKNSFGGIQLRYSREVMTRHSDNLRPGNIVDFINKNSGAVEKCLFLKTIETRDGYDLSIMQPTNSVLRWVDRDGQLQEQFCIFEYNTRSNFGLDEDRVMSMPDGRRQVIVQSNSHTRNLKRDKRFIFDSQVFKVIDFDWTSDEGLVNLSLKEDLINESTDNLEIGIADYFGNVSNYALQILNGESFSVQVGNTLQLQATVTNNGVTVQKDVVWSVSDDTIATVNEDGILSANANGQVVVTAMLQDHTSVTDTAVVTIEFSTSNNYSIELDSSLELLVGTSKTFTAIIKNNLVVDPTQFVQWYLTDDTGISVTTLATMTFSSTTQCTIKGHKSGYVKLKAVLIGSSPILSQTFRIKVESLI